MISQASDQLEHAYEEVDLKNMRRSGCTSIYEVRQGSIHKLAPRSAIFHRGGSEGLRAFLLRVVRSVRHPQADLQKP